MTFHLTHIKDGFSRCGDAFASRCDDPLYQRTRSDFDKVVNPLIYTPGDHEWTDLPSRQQRVLQPAGGAGIHPEGVQQARAAVGHNPIKVYSQAWFGFPENVNLRRQRVDFAVVNVVGSKDDLQPWTGIGSTRPRADRSSRRGCRWLTRSTWCTRPSPRLGTGTTGLWR